MQIQPVTGNASRKVETYAWMGYMSRELREHCAVDIEKVLQRDLEYEAECVGYVPIPDTFTIKYIDHRDPDTPEWWFTAEQRKVLDETDAITVRTSLRCYKAVR